MLKIGVIGSGTMGAGIAQIAAMNGHEVLLYDASSSALRFGQEKFTLQINKLVDKSKITNQEAVAILGRLYCIENIQSIRECDLIIEAIVEDITLKFKLFGELSEMVNIETILASNTSSFSITQLASSYKFPQRFIGMHFFNPAPIMPLVEIIPAVQTSQETLEDLKEIIASWNKVGVIAKDTPGFIVNRIARPYYTEAIRIYEEGLADIGTIDKAMTEIYGFKMGPFLLMDFIGHDVNYNVTKSVWEACNFEPRYKPSYTQRNLLHANWLGKKTGKGFYNYLDLEGQISPVEDKEVLKDIAWRILVMLINEAADALYYQIATRQDIELAMIKGVNYPKGLLAWAEEIGIDHCISTMDRLFDYYKEERYRCSPGLKKLKS